MLAIAAHKSQEVAVVLAPLAQALREAFGEPWAAPAADRGRHPRLRRALSAQMCTVR